MSSEQTTPTPETDAESAWRKEIPRDAEIVPADFARRLERRLADSQAECERLRVIAREAAESATRHQADVLRLRDNISTLVAGPMMHHHKMDASDIRAAEAFDRCRELTLANFATHFALSDAIRAAMQSEQGAQG